MKEELSQESLKFELLDERLSDLHKGKLFAFNQDKEMMKAVEIALFYAVNEMGTVKKGDKHIHDINWAYSVAQPGLTDEQVGNALRLRSHAHNLVYDAFKQIVKFGQEKARPTEEKNVAL